MTEVIVSGKGFVDEDGNTARCRFGTPANYAIVDAQILCNYLYLFIIYYSL